MVDWLKSNLDSLLLVSPILLSYCIYFIVLKISKKKWKAIHISVQLTTILYVIAVGLIFYRLFQINVTSYLVVFHIFLLAIILVRQRILDTEVILYDGLRLLLRWSFLIFAFSYIFLGLYYVFTILINIF